MLDTIERGIANAEDSISEWQRAFGDLHRLVSKFVVQAEDWVTIVLDAENGAITHEALDDLLGRDLVANRLSWHNGGRRVMECNAAN